ncbi:MAG: deoxyguanosinetriphosphate triphosphohydrolase [Gammaproteobacteria bacterium]|nr:deoxyguanosinetriphosphate triphosphohydrolase [Gammaproteobacteria bacterium]MCW8909196.1 deoxyguanosinetriphosphate triphosphohydrolase [Gammaproteobacteria bacterium]MCW9004039.1 deoxyguanosinetriphosphate triphosphohydrolase [Gammaproteobacteria bacterium]
MDSGYDPNNLAAYACSDKTSRGRLYQEPPPVHRNNYQRDRDRIIHSAAFRRLEYKTQVFVNHEGDLFRTRLTHSLEVSQIARSIARELKLHEDLAETIALAHDLGHAPFGHAGQDALNRCMKNYGGFEHNLQSLRVVDELEEKYAEFPGLNLTYESREGILKHCSTKDAKLLGDLGQRFFNKNQTSLEAQACDLADEIAYNNHDIDDGLRYGLITIDQLLETQIFRDQYETVNQLHPGINQRRQIHEIIRRMINRMVVDLIETSKSQLIELDPQHPDEAREQNHYIISFSDEIKQQNLELKRFLRHNLYRHYRVQRMTNKAENVLSALFEAFIEDPNILPPEAKKHCDQLTKVNKETGTARGIADYIAGMTDRYAIVEYERIFNPRQLSFVNLIP